MKLIFFLIFSLNSFQTSKAATAFEMKKMNDDAMKAWNVIESNSITNYPQAVSNLLASDFYFSSIPIIKEYLSKVDRINNFKVDEIIDQLIVIVGTRHFELMPERILDKSRSASIRYIIAKKAFKRHEYEKAIQESDTIKETHPIYPFAMLIKGASETILKNESRSLLSFKECIAKANNQISELSGLKKEKFTIQKIKQLNFLINYCEMGMARANFSAKNYSQAQKEYFKIDKKSFLWPEILFEEGWNNFYLKNYNRTLGKLVTYNAPVLNYIFNPEIDVLQALTYYELCLWKDSSMVVEKFYSKYEKKNEELQGELKKLGNNNKSYFLLMLNFIESRRNPNSLLEKMFKSIARDPAFTELLLSYEEGKKEISRIKMLRSKEMRELLSENLHDTLTINQLMIGSYVKNQLNTNVKQILKSFEDMSNIKLEVLSHKKDDLFKSLEGIDTSLSKGKRGDEKSLVRLDSEYYWKFNQEFWADELGDYVFSLKSECH